MGLPNDTFCFQQHFSHPYNAVIVGASGGIGRALTDVLLQDDHCQQLYACSRRPLALNHPRLTHLTVDITREDSIQQAATIIAQPVDMVIVATGVLHNESGLRPEKSLRQFTAQSFIDVAMVNTIGPVLVAKHFFPLLPKKTTSVFAVLSARVGSISDNRLGGWYSYRATKSALNMMIKNLAIEYRHKLPKSLVVGLHPGTVDTSLSKPFQSAVPEEKLFSAQQSAQYLLSVIDQLDREDSGRCFAWDGKEIPA